jgi:hypothetical protein
LIILQEMTGFGQTRVRLALGTGYAVNEDLLRDNVPCSGVEVR